MTRSVTGRVALGHVFDAACVKKAGPAVNKTGGAYRERWTFVTKNRFFMTDS
jgi:hypothetical protein